MHRTLSLILEAKKKRIAVLRKNSDAIRALVKKAPTPISFKNAIKRDGKLSLIAEVKQASPLTGVLCKDFSPLKIAKIYESAKVNAISVLTEEEFFMGKINDIEEIKGRVKVPILRKDFILEEVQVLESRAVGADAILLIASILEEERFTKLYSLAKDLGMDVLAEVHSEKELRKILSLGVDIVGINNRNLHTLKVDIVKTQKLAPFIPADIIKVSESGIRSLKDILWLKGLGVDAVLVGRAIMESEDFASKIKEFQIDG
ncbi:MAG: indole-3-glycerol phosphate synthase TrpC [Candidatus Omnitrophica bacterium]|nr:indole-3-glycerol phosphate synthase TrpC [Candidatus Omnitrophota bacterium]